MTSSAMASHSSKSVAWFGKNKVVAGYFVQKRENGDYVPSAQELTHVQETLQLLSIMTNDISDRSADEIWPDWHMAGCSRSRSNDSPCCCMVSEAGPKVIAVDRRGRAVENRL